MVVRLTPDQKVGGSIPSGVIFRSLNSAHILRLFSVGIGGIGSVVARLLSEKPYNCRGKGVNEILVP